MLMKNKPKNIANIFLIFITSLLFFTACGKKASDGSFFDGTSKIENPFPRKINPLRLGQADQFAILAYASISSVPNSSINGKVGLMPGQREQIEIDPGEVLGGAINIMGSDDETTPANLLSNAKVDMVTAYKEAVALVADSDKIGLFEGKLGGNILSPGCYKWNGDLAILSDFTIEGSDSDVWIFQIPANLKVTNGIHLFLSGGARAKNIFWQVSGSAVIEAGSEFAGTIIAQQSVILKNHSILTGRAFAKNGYVELDRAVINKPL